ncbi:MAG: MBL fold metallo-hydrolase [Herpetosiphonaceae bacterium]|nr:MBL fold metallo-hydrolase [Herpetosiphonaceae bacterium]
MLYHNLDPELPRNLPDLLRWRLSRRNLPPPPVERTVLPQSIHNDGSALRTGDNTLTWIGHASIVLQLDGYTILCDPVWSNAITRFVPRLSQPGLNLENVPPPDLVLLSHNHYDHLDLPTLRRLDPKTQIFVPAGLRQYMHRRGFRHVQEFGWWDSTTVGPLRITFVPAQHWSRRLPWDTNKSWWGGYVIEGTQRVYFAGDSALFSGFQEVAARFPRLDWAILPIGAYDPRWFMVGVHMNPEEAGEVWKLLGAQHMLPIHYGTFRLTDEPVGEPALRLRAWWEAQGLEQDRLWMPQLGETRRLDRIEQEQPLQPVGA